MAAAPFAGPGHNMVLVEPAMGGCPRLMLAPVGVRLPAGVHLVTLLAVATRTSTRRRVRAVAAAVPPAEGSLTAATGCFFGDRNAPGFGAAAGHGVRHVGPLPGVLATMAGSGCFRAKSVVARAGDGPTDPTEASDADDYVDKFRVRLPGAAEVGRVGTRSPRPTLLWEWEYLN